MTTWHKNNNINDYLSDTQTLAALAQLASVSLFGSARTGNMTKNQIQNQIQRPKPLNQAPS